MMQSRPDREAYWDRAEFTTHLSELIVSRNAAMLAAAESRDTASIDDFENLAAEVQEQLKALNELMITGKTTRQLDDNYVQQRIKGSIARLAAARRVE